MKQLLVGCGKDTRKKVVLNGNTEWDSLTTLDFSPSCNPDIVWDLRNLPYPFEDNSFDEIHAYDVLEHLGTQGDFKTFFEEFTEFHRILKPHGLFVILVPHWQSEGAWGDPGHTRVLAPTTFAFLSQKEYEAQVGKTPMTDYREYYKADFDILALSETEDKQKLLVLLQAIKKDY